MKTKGRGERKVDWSEAGSGFSILIAGRLIDRAAGSDAVYR
jgi:hypothetical protein